MNLDKARMDSSLRAVDCLKKGNGANWFNFGSTQKCKIRVTLFSQPCFPVFRPCFPPLFLECIHGHGDGMAIAIVSGGWDAGGVVSTSPMVLLTVVADPLDRGRAIDCSFPLNRSSISVLHGTDLRRRISVNLKWVMDHK